MHKVQIRHLGAIARGVEPANPRRPGRRRGHAELHGLIARVEQEQQSMRRIVAVAEHGAESPQAAILPVILSDFAAASVQPAHIFDPCARGSAFEEGLAA